MPILGEVKSGQHIGRRHWRTFVWLACLQCGWERWVCRASLKHHGYTGLCYDCIHRLRGERSNRWKGGRTTKQGYIVVQLTPGNFFYSMADSKGKVYEHRLIMAQHLNRHLLPWEIVHHINGAKDDNRLENLRLLPASKYHLPSMKLQHDVKDLQRRVMELETETRLLRWQNKSLLEQLEQRSLK